jgi:two-component system response regulator HydG
MTAYRPVVLLVDDEPGTVDLVGQFAERAGFDVVPCSGGRQVLGELRTRRADLVMVDLRMPDVDGLDVLYSIRDADPHCQVVLMTSYASVETAVEAIKLGAVDYLSKPIDFARLERLLNTVRDESERRRGVLSLESDLARRLEFFGMVGRAPVMHDLFAMIRRLAPHLRTALISGEAGTGKELVARALHALGPRCERRFVSVNCSAVVESIFESELFGHVRGAFAGADENKAGLLEMADAGTLFLDEIGELPLGLQAKLLRVLEMGEVFRVGSHEAKRVNAYVIAATNRDLRIEVAAGRFRSDLYYRLNNVEIRLPALRDRREDIPYLTASFVKDTSDRLQKSLLGLTPGAERLLNQAHWEGNVRELRHVVERACILADTELVTERELAISMPPRVTMRGAGRSTTSSAPQGQADADLLVNVEREHIQRALVRAGGNKKAAAKMLGLSRRALYRRLERLDLAATISRRRDATLVEASS